MLIREGCAELPASNEVYTHQQYSEFPVLDKSHIHPGPYSEFNHPVDMRGMRLPTYEEAEWAPVASSGPQQTTHDRQPSADPFSAAQVVDPVDRLDRLPCPVVIPRCKGSERQFERIYAPVLANCGISQETFWMFLDDFEHALREPRAAQCISVASDISHRIVGMAPAVTGLTVEVAAGTKAREMQFSWQANTFLDLANQELFMPFGLYAVVMRFTDTIPGPQQQPLIELSQMLGKTVFATENFDIIQAASASGYNPPQGTTNIELPTAAPLEAKRSSYHKAKHGSKHPGLIARWKELKRPESNDNLVSRLSGGRSGSKPGLIERAAISIKESQDSRRKFRQEKEIEYSSRSLQPGVPYLMIVNLPSQDELQQSVGRLETILLQAGQGMP
ncbi:hypothetical protein P170DRAFT_474444 [Aspergillus steynii IBT 23096]|uniref:Uncharacterized protein n=1 Tax=Aspergillus steynii IBT 23096 TaxID=1392250 RepID=A0A2I2GDC9_9EURO|nr:uncharacterized protein P170DRAFT_474444 [Aspergillus steynii IBT 23096]PLB50895.1 hypothetical protein P170DRAFT_474444 [Aspergillus steynii IBT 23096]